MIKINAAEEPYFQIPAHRFKQGRRTAYTFALDLERLDSMIPQRVNQKVVREANRRLTPSHAKKIENYLRTRDNWVLGSILLGIDPEAVQFTPYKNEDGQDLPDFGELRIPSRKWSTIRLFDGQHRRRAIQDLLAGLHELEVDRTNALSEAKSNGISSEFIQSLSDQLTEIREKINSFREKSVPVVLYEEGDISALRQMFADAAQTKSIEAVTKARFDERDPFNRAAREVAEQSELLRGRIEMERSTVAHTSPNLLSFNQLSTTLKTLVFGYYGRVSRLRSIEFDADHEPIIKLGIDWADEFLPAACPEYEKLLDREAMEDVYMIPTMRRDTFALNATVLRVLAACYHGWREKIDEDEKPLAEFLRRHSFKNTLKRSLLVRAGLVLPGSTSPVGRRQEVQKTINFILDRAQKDRLESGQKK